MCLHVCIRAARYRENLRLANAVEYCDDDMSCVRLDSTAKLYIDIKYFISGDIDSY